MRHPSSSPPEKQLPCHAVNLSHPGSLCAGGHIFSRVQPFYERAASDLDRYMHISLWVQVTHSSFIEGSHTTKNTASAYNLCVLKRFVKQEGQNCFCQCHAFGRSSKLYRLIQQKKVFLTDQRDSLIALGLFLVLFDFRILQQLFLILKIETLAP